MPKYLKKQEVKKIIPLLSLNTLQKIAIDHMRRGNHKTIINFNNNWKRVVYSKTIYDYYKALIED